ncbi:class Ib ribonucleoside-diphosphate reductase assembly flavoprotein NrdI [Streptomyces sp. NPDC059477]|uniref:class Ib ribonucleoside-diphosphate reductase assembly flavoprotein NrdI n=1 Tax=Streptomyces sp. NPDC059477 TaxID=3346847 RepID=UPI0036752519
MSGLVYFSGISENTKCFVEKLELPATRIPLHPQQEGMPQVTVPYVLIVPTYGSDQRSDAVPKQVIRFLDIEANRALLRGVIACGSTNFGEEYCLAGPVISAKYKVPELYRFERDGTALDVRTVREGLEGFWARQSATAGQPPLS